MTVSRLGLESPPNYTSNSYAPDVLESTTAWARRHTIEEVVGASEADMLVRVSVGLAALTGYNLNKQGLEESARQCTWLFAWDAFADNEVGGAGRDRPDEFYEIFDSIEALLEDPTRYGDAPNSFMSSLAHLASYMKQSANPMQFKRWANALKGYVGGVELELHYRDFDEVPDLETFVAMRQETSGVRVVLAMIEPTQNSVVPEEAWLDEAGVVPRVTELAVDIIAWDNDLTSYEGEQRDGRAQLNLVTVLQRERGCTLEEAVQEAIDMRNHKEAELLGLERQLQHTPTDPHTLQYVAGVKQWIYGYLQFAKKHARYNRA